MSLATDPINTFPYFPKEIPHAVSQAICLHARTIIATRAEDTTICATEADVDITQCQVQRGGI